MSNGLPTREVCAIARLRCGLGHVQEYTLSCGHRVEHIGRHDLHLGSMTGCEECR